MHCVWDHSITHINLSVGVFSVRGGELIIFIEFPFMKRSWCGKEGAGQKGECESTLLNVCMNCICSSSHGILVREAKAGGPELR